VPDTMTLAKYRLETALETLNDAKALFESGGYKGGNNRAYYSIFHGMRAVLALEKIDFKKHSGVISYFQQKYIKTGIFDVKYSAVIKSASLIRNQSDYDDFYLASREETQEQIANAEIFLTAVKNYLDSKE